MEMGLKFGQFLSFYFNNTNIYNTAPQEGDMPSSCRNKYGARSMEGKAGFPSILSPFVGVS